MRIEFHPGAEADANDAQQWYAERNAIAARAFTAELIAANPAIGPNDTKPRV